MQQQKINDVNAVVERYFHSTYHGDERAIRFVFHPQAMINGYVGDQCLLMNVDSFIGNIMARPIAAENNECYDKRIQQTLCQSRSAIVLARNLVGDTYFADQINLLLIDDEWKIISKVFESIDN